MPFCRRRAAVILLAGATAALAGCSALPGPTGFGGGEPGSSTLCAPITTGEQVLLGEVVYAPDDADITIVEVTLDSPHGVSLERVTVMPIYPETGNYGIGSAHVPPEDPPPGWDERVAAAGAVVEAGDMGAITAQVKRTSDDDAGFAAIHLVYESEHIRYEKSASTMYELKDSCGT